MKENVKNNENNSRILKSNTKTSKQPPISEIIQSKKKYPETSFKNESFEIDLLNKTLQMKPEGLIIQLGKKKKNTDGVLTDFMERWRTSSSVMIGEAYVIPATSYPEFSIENRVYHITTSSATNHVSDTTSNERKKYFFRGTGNDIEPCRPEGSESGRSSEMFNKLPEAVQEFIKNNWSNLFTQPVVKQSAG